MDDGKTKEYGDVEPVHCPDPDCEYCNKNEQIIRRLLIARQTDFAVDRYWEKRINELHNENDRLVKRLMDRGE